MRTCAPWLRPADHARSPVLSAAWRIWRQRGWQCRCAGRQLAAGHRLSQAHHGRQLRHPRTVDQFRGTSALVRPARPSVCNPSAVKIRAGGGSALYRCACSLLSGFENGGSHAEKHWSQAELPDGSENAASRNRSLLIRRDRIESRFSRRLPRIAGRRAPVALRCPTSEAVRTSIPPPHDRWRFRRGTSRLGTACRVRAR